MSKEDYQKIINHERLETASHLRDIMSRIGPGASPEWVKEELRQLANQLEVWARLKP